MTYPLSNDVSAGQPTAAAHYNNLRADALRLGAGAQDAVLVGELLARYETGLALERLGSNRVRVLVAPDAPACLVVDGVPLRAGANVDLATSAAPSGAAAEYCIFAVCSPGSGTFTLEINTSTAEASLRRRIGRFYWDGNEIGRDSVRSEQSSFLVERLGYVQPQTCCGRLTLSSGEAVPLADTSSGTLYLTPHLGNRAALFVPGLGWRNYTFNELSISLAGKSTGKMLDVFLFDNGGTLALELVEWSNDSTRATQLALQDGVWVKSGAAARRYLGTVRIASNGMGESSLLRRYVWNLNHPQPLPLLVSDTGAHTYTIAAWRSWNNNTGLRTQFIQGLGRSVQFGLFARLAYSTAAGGQLSLGLDSGVMALGPNLANLASSLATLSLSGNQLVVEGYHYMQALELGSASYNSDQVQVTALVWA